MDAQEARRVTALHKQRMEEDLIASRTSPIRRAVQKGDSEVFLYYTALEKEEVKEREDFFRRLGYEVEVSLACVEYSNYIFKVSW